MTPSRYPFVGRQFWDLVGAGMPPKEAGSSRICRTRHTPGCRSMISSAGPRASSFVFAADGHVLTSESTLRFREREEVEADLVARGFVVDEVRGAPDRPGREFVFIAGRPE